MSNDEKISISPTTGDFSEKDFSDGVINKQKQKAAVEAGVIQDAWRKSLLMGRTLQGLYQMWCKGNSIE